MKGRGKRAKSASPRKTATRYLRNFPAQDGKKNFRNGSLETPARSPAMSTGNIG
jgi:hypothetical protein